MSKTDHQNKKIEEQLKKLRAELDLLSNIMSGSTKGKSNTSDKARIDSKNKGNDRARGSKKTTGNNKPAENSSSASSHHGSENKHKGSSKKDKKSHSERKKRKKEDTKKGASTTSPLEKRMSERTLEVELQDSAQVPHKPSTTNGLSGGGTTGTAVSDANGASSNFTQESNRGADSVSDIFGLFDGEDMVTPEGVGYEVPPNYAAKSKLVYGDNLSMYTEGNRVLFKQVGKEPRERHQGEVTKEGDVWYVSVKGRQFVLSSAAMAFNNIEPGAKIWVLLPEDNENVPFATFDETATAEDISDANSKGSENSKKNATTLKDIPLDKMLDDDLR